MTENFCKSKGNGTQFENFYRRMSRAVFQESADQAFLTT